MPQNPKILETFQIHMVGIDITSPITGHFGFSTLMNDHRDTDNRNIDLVGVGGDDWGILDEISEAHLKLAYNSCILQE